VNTSIIFSSCRVALLDQDVATCPRVPVNALGVVGVRVAAGVSAGTAALGSGAELLDGVVAEDSAGTAEDTAGAARTAGW